MSMYLFQDTCTGEGVKGLLKESDSSRRAATEKMVQSMGGKIETYYFCFGEHDCHAIDYLPENNSAKAVALTVSASSAVALKTTVLMTPAEVDVAAKKSTTHREPVQ
jgi:uncharacterized protein with GYD domain